MPIRIVGVCGSPVKGGNTEVFLTEALKTAEAIGGVSTDLVRLIEKRIGDCRHCNWCLSKQAEGSFCNIKDDMMEMYPKIIDADAILLASPTYGVVYLDTQPSSLTDGVRWCWASATVVS